MFLLPPPEGLEALNQQIQDAYSGITNQANSLFDTMGLSPILEATRLDPATMTAIGSVMGASPPRLGIMQRLMDRLAGVQPGAAVPVSSLRPIPKGLSSGQVAKEGNVDFMRQYLKLRYPELFPQGEGGRKLGELMRATRPEADIRMLQEGGYVKPLTQGRKLPEVDPGWIKGLIKGGQIP